MEILGKIFGSQAKVRIIRLFLFNPEKVFDAKEIARRSQTTVKTVTREVRPLESSGLVKKRTIVLPQRRTERAENSERRIRSGWTLNQKFPYLAALQNLVINTVLIKDDEILNRLVGVGQIKLLITSGVFIQES